METAPNFTASCAYYGLSTVFHVSMHERFGMHPIKKSSVTDRLQHAPSEPHIVKPRPAAAIQDPPRYYATDL